MDRMKIALVLVLAGCVRTKVTSLGNGWYLASGSGGIQHSQADTIHSAAEEAVKTCARQGAGLQPQFYETMNTSAPAFSANRSFAMGGSKPSTSMYFRCEPPETPK
jgi:hypothetical protein